MNDFSPELSPRSTIANDLVFVDGCMRSGKHLLGTVIASFERMEMWQNLVLVENLPTYHALGKITRDAAIQMMQIEIDTYFYYTLIGRRVNFRYGDASGIWNSPNPKEYFRRIFSDEEAGVLERLTETRPISLIFTHDIMANPEIPFAAYPTIRIVEMRRNPVDVAHSWLRKDWPARITNDPMSTAPAIGATQKVPWFAADWADEYLAMNATGRIIRALDSIEDRRESSSASLTDAQRRQVLSIGFEHFVTRPDPWLEQLGGFMDTAVSAQTAEILHREQCPRELLAIDYSRKREELEGSLDADGRARLDRMENRYRDWCRAALGTDDSELRI